MNNRNVFKARTVYIDFVLKLYPNASIGIYGGFATVELLGITAFRFRSSINQAFLELLRSSDES